MHAHVATVQAEARPGQAQRRIACPWLRRTTARIRASNSSGSHGVIRKSSAPWSSDLTFACTVAVSDMIITGVLQGRRAHHADHFIGRNIRQLQIHQHQIIIIEAQEFESFAPGGCLLAADTMGLQELLVATAANSRITDAQNEHG